MDVHPKRRWLRGHLGSKLLGVFNTPLASSVITTLSFVSHKHLYRIACPLFGGTVLSQLNVSRTQIPSSLRIFWVVAMLHEYRVIIQSFELCHSSICKGFGEWYNGNNLADGDRLVFPVARFDSIVCCDFEDSKQGEGPVSFFFFYRKMLRFVKNMSVHSTNSQSTGQMYGRQLTQDYVVLGLFGCPFKITLTV